MDRQFFEKEVSGKSFRQVPATRQDLLSFPGRITLTILLSLGNPVYSGIKRCSHTFQLYSH